jgi:alanine racemase
MVTAERAGAILTIDLDAIAANYRLLRDRAEGAVCAAVIKADAYGLGIGPVAAALVGAGCRDFFVALPAEGIALRDVLAAAAADARIYVLDGLASGEEATYARHGLTPVLNTADEIAAWRAFAATSGARRKAAVHIDTGMARLGLDRTAIETLAADRGAFEGLDMALVMSHLACAYDENNPLNGAQRALFDAGRALIPAAPASLANSSGIFLGAEFHYDLVRPGASLFGIAPLSGSPNPMAQVIRLQGKILQVRDVDRGQTVGYGATHRVTRQSRLATVGVGYADGYLRFLGNRGSAFIGEVPVPVVGRVSMDLITLDVTDVPLRAVHPGALVDLISDRHTVDQLAAEAGTIGYEILTGLGARFHRLYVGKAA